MSPAKSSKVKGNRRVAMWKTTDQNLKDEEEGRGKRDLKC